MKYYKLLTKWGYPHSCFIMGKIYPETFKRNENDDQLSVLEIQKTYSNDWQEVPAGDYYVQEGKMPEYFAIKRVDNDPLWKKYINWFRKKYDHSFDGSATWYGFDGNTNYSNMFWSSLNKFKNTPIELTLEQWDKIVNKTMEEEFKLPENWYIDVTDDNVDMLNKWYNSEYFTLTDEHLVGMNKWDYGCTKKGHNFKGITKGKTYDFGTKITTEQFIKYVLKEEVMKENDGEIIGWKLKENCEQYRQAALIICNTTGNWENSLMPYDISIKQTGYITRLKNAGILKLWFEPVLATKLPTLLGYEGKICENFISYGCKKYLKEDIKQLLKYLEIFNIDSVSIKEGLINIQSLKDIIKIC